MRVFIAACAIAIGLGFLLIWRSPLITKGVYKAAFFLGLVALGAIFLSPSSNMTIHLSRSPVAPFALVPFLIVAVAPLVLLVEAGMAGYRGFSSWVRYVSLALAVLGGIGLVAAFLLPRLLRRL